MGGERREGERGGAGERGGEGERGGGGGAVICLSLYHRYENIQESLGSMSRSQQSTGVSLLSKHMSGAVRDANL